jgi:hypothetical protein
MPDDGSQKVKGDQWHVGAMTDWNERTREIDLSFLGNGNFKAEIFKDKINAGKVAKDYVKETFAVPKNRKIIVTMATGDGFATKLARYYPKPNLPNLPIPNIPNLTGFQNLLGYNACVRL